jgi:selenocysteine lyase/cysteine desulfurase
LQLRNTFTALHDRGAILTDQLSHGLEETGGVKLYGPPPTAPRTSTIAFTLSGVPASEVARRLAERGLFLSHGNFYAATVITRLNLAPEGLVRAGCACYTTASEIDRLIQAVRAISQ